MHKGVLFEIVKNEEKKSEVEKGVLFETVEDEKRETERFHIFLLCILVLNIPRIIFLLANR